MIADYGCWLLIISYQQPTISNQQSATNKSYGGKVI